MDEEPVPEEQTEEARKRRRDAEKDAAAPAGPSVEEKLKRMWEPPEDGTPPDEM